jgi:hypothetical protein
VQEKDMARQKTNISLPLSGAFIETLLDSLAALLITFVTALVLLHLIVRYGIPMDNLVLVYLGE